MIKVWYLTGFVQTYPNLQDAEREIAEIMALDHNPATFIKSEDKDVVYRCKVTVELEPVPT